MDSEDFLGGRDVFERLYLDALRRMRTQAEVQARLAEERVNVCRSLRIEIL